MMILNFDEAEVRVVYDYDKYDKKDTPDDTSDDSIDLEESEFKFVFSGAKLNSFKKDAYPGYVYTSINDTVTNPKQVFLKGGDGIMAEIELFKDDNGDDVLEEIRSKPWLVNEANLSLYMRQRNVVSQRRIIELSRLYLTISKIRLQSLIIL